MVINIKKLKPNATIPTKGTKYSAGLDLYACIDKPTKIRVGETVKFSTGIGMEIPQGYVGLIFARSGLGIKNGLAPANKVGVIDSDFRGELIVALHNDVTMNLTVFEPNISNEYTVVPNERIAQIVIMPCVDAELNEVDELNDTERGDGGFGSSGK